VIIIGIEEMTAVSVKCPHFRRAWAKLNKSRSSWILIRECKYDRQPSYPSHNTPWRASDFVSLLFYWFIHL